MLGLNKGTKLAPYVRVNSSKLGLRTNGRLCPQGGAAFLIGAQSSSEIGATLSPATTGGQTSQRNSSLHTTKQQAQPTSQCCTPATLAS